MTLLIIRALAKVEERDKNTLLALLGNNDIGQPELETAQAIIENSGALAYSQGLAKRYGLAATEQLLQAPPNMTSATAFLGELSNMLLARQK